MCAAAMWARTSTTQRLITWMQLLLAMVGDADGTWMLVARPLWVQLRAPHGCVLAMGCDGER